MSTKPKKSQSENNSKNAENLSLQTEVLQDMHEEIQDLNKNILALHQEIIELRNQNKNTNILLCIITVILFVTLLASYHLYSAFMSTAYIKWAKEINNIYKGFFD